MATQKNQSKAKYTSRQKRQAQHIEDSYRQRGLSTETAAERAWATVNKQDGGGKMPGGSGRAKSSKTNPRTSSQGKKK